MKDTFTECGDDVWIIDHEAGGRRRDSACAPNASTTDPRRLHVDLEGLGLLFGRAAGSTRTEKGENVTIKSQALKSAIVAVGFVIVAAVPGPARAADVDWKAVEQALGKSGRMQAGNVFRVAMPRADLKVKVQGVDVKPGFALGSYAAFKKMAKDTMVMGDLVLLDEEVQDVMARLIRKGIAITALHNHLNEMSPHVMYMH